MLRVRKRNSRKAFSLLLSMMLVLSLASPGVAVFADEATSTVTPPPAEAPPVPEPPAADEEAAPEEPAQGADAPAQGAAEEPVDEPEAAAPAVEVAEEAVALAPTESREAAPVTAAAVAVTVDARTDNGQGPRDDFPEPVTVGEACDLTTIAILWAGQHHEAGSVSAYNDDTNLYVTFETTGGWEMGLTHLYVGTTPPASYAPGSFPYQTSHDPMVTTYTYTIPLADIGAVAGDTIYIASHAEVHNGEQSETAWAGTGQWPGLLFGHVVQECEEPELPDLTVVKFEDLDEDGEHDEGEPLLEGFTFEVRMDSEVVTSGVTGEDGKVVFVDLQPGDYEIHEVDLPEGWTPTTELPVLVSLVEDQDVEVHIGNVLVVQPPEDIVKTFRLTFVDAPEGVTFEVDYVLGEEDPVTVELTGDGPYEGSESLAYGSTITVYWYAVVGQERILLGTTGPETLYEDTLNEFDYEAEVAGYKFNDLDADGVWDEGEPGIEGWTIYLHRVIGEVVEAEPLAVTMTGADGSYSFTGLLPGLYYLAEEEREGWFMTVRPDDLVEIGNGSMVDGLVFGNAREQEEEGFIDLAIIKDAEDGTFAPGDEVTYTLRYRNNGTEPATDFTIVDDYDERYLEVVDANGGTVADGKITWLFDGPLASGDGEQVLTYTLRVLQGLPEDLSVISNVAEIVHPDDVDPSDNEDDAEIPVEEFLPFTPPEEPEEDPQAEEEYLPFTGGEARLLALLTALMVALGAVSRLLRGRASA